MRASTSASQARGSTPFNFVVAIREYVDLPDKPDLALPASLSNRHSMAHFGDVQPHEDFAILPHGSFSCAEDRLAPASNPRSLAQCGTSHLARQRTYGLTENQAIDRE